MTQETLGILTTRSTPRRASSLAIAAALVVPLVLGLVPAAVVGQAFDPPQVGIAATIPTGTEDQSASTSTAAFTVARADEERSDPLLVVFDVLGDATIGAAADFYLEYEGFDGTNPILRTCVSEPCESLLLRGGEPSKDITVVILDDAADEPRETITVTLQSCSGPAGCVVNAQSTSDTVTIIDDDEPTVSVAATIPAAAEPSTAGEFTFARTTGDTSASLVVVYRVLGDAQPGADYVALSGVVTIPAGAATTAVAVTPIDDRSDELLETVHVDVLPESSSSYIVADAPNNAADVTIADDDVPTVSVTSPDQTASEDGEEVGQFSIARNSADNTALLAVEFSLGGDATVVADYGVTGATCAGTLCLATILATEAQVPIIVTPVDDDDDEKPEPVTLNLLASSAMPATYTVGIPASAALTIQDNDLPEVSVEATDDAAAEPADVGVFTFRRTDGDVTLPLTVTFAVTGTATSGADYTFAPACTTATCTITIPPQSTMAALTVTPVDDLNDETPENIVVTLLADPADPDTYELSLVDTITDEVTLGDNDPPKVSITALDADAAEAVVPLTALFQVSRTTGDTAQSLDVKFDLDGTADLGALLDYEVTPPCATNPCTVTIPANVATATILVTPRDDGDVEPTETVIADLVLDAGAPGSYTIDGTADSAQANIRDNEPNRVTVAATDAAASEGDPVTNLGTFTVTREGDLTNAVTVAYATTGSATSGIDYQALTGTVDILATAATATITVTPIDDLDDEAPEDVVVTLSAGSYTIGDPDDATVTIADDDPPAITVVANDPAASETSLGSAQFTFTRTAGDLAANLEVIYALSGTAMNGADYSVSPSCPASPCRVTILSGAQNALVTVTPVDDSMGEGPETVTVTIQDGAALYTAGTPSTATATIADNDLPTVVIAAQAAVVAEDAGAGSFVVTRISGDRSVALVVQYNVGGTADAGTDYAALEGAVTILANEDSAVIAVLPSPDSEDEATETVTVVLRPGPGRYGTSSAAVAASVRILDVDDPTVTIAATDAAAGETAANVGVFTVTRVGDTSAPLSVEFTLAGTATNGVDYRPVPGEVVIPAGSTNAQVIIIPNDDSVAEPSETVIATLAPGPGYIVGGANQATVNLADNDRATVVISTVVPVGSELGETPAVIGVSRVGDDLTRALTVFYTVSGTATNGADYAALLGSVEIPVGASTATILVETEDDMLLEGPETVNLVLAPNANYALVGGALSASAVIVSNE